VQSSYSDHVVAVFRRCPIALHEAEHHRQSIAERLHRHGGRHEHENVASDQAPHGGRNRLARAPQPLNVACVFHGLHGHNHTVRPKVRGQHLVVHGDEAAANEVEAIGEVSNGLLARCLSVGPHHVTRGRGFPTC